VSEGREAQGARQVPEFGFPSDIVAGYHVRLLYYELLDIFCRKGISRASSWLVQASWDLLSLAEGWLREKGWRTEALELGGRKILLARRASEGITMGLVASRCPDGVVVTALCSAEDEESVGRALGELGGLMEKVGGGALGPGE